MVLIASFLSHLQIVTHYNQLHEVEEKPCKHFDLAVTIEESSGKFFIFPTYK